MLRLVFWNPTSFANLLQILHDSHARSPYCRLRGEAKNLENECRKRMDKYMSKINVVRAWKDEKYRRSLSAEEQAMLPANPVGRVELSDAQLDSSGAKGKVPESYFCTFTCTYGKECPSNPILCFTQRLP
jgi:mersacidin/lichenicidin family type 2 lantibiotic